MHVKHKIKLTKV